MSGKYELILDLMINGFKNGEGGLLVSTNRDAESVISDFESRTQQPLSLLRLVDCVSEQQNAPGTLSEDVVEYVSSPADLTGIGIGVSEQLQGLGEQGVNGIRIGFYSLSTLLMYAEVETVFRFLHVLTGRVSGADGLGLFSIDPTTHDQGTVNTLKQLFDGMIELRDENGTRQIRIQGIEDISSEWRELE
ncbi:MAG: RAD55 family ATPase [Halobacteriales archaeon]